jgi:hypothetical protein
VKKLRAAQSARPGASQVLRFTAPVAGWYFVELKAAAPGFGAYALKVTKAPRR